MQIKIKSNAVAIYCRQFTEQMIPNREWANTLQKVQGMTLEVETDFLFNNQFNTAPIPDVSELGLRITEDTVEAVIDDIRPNFVKCRWCGKQSPKASLACLHCAKEGYLEPLDPAAPRTDCGLRRAGEEAAREGQPPQYPGVTAYMDGYKAEKNEQPDAQSTSTEDVARA